MKGRNISRFVLLTLTILFTTIYLMQSFGYYEFTNLKTNRLTESQIKQFEQDVKDGKKIEAKNYVRKQINYNNKLSKGALSLSNAIEKTFDNVMNFLFSEVNKAVND